MMTTGQQNQTLKKQNSYQKSAKSINRSVTPSSLGKYDDDESRYVMTVKKSIGDLTVENNDNF